MMRPSKSSAPLVGVVLVALALFFGSGRAEAGHLFEFYTDAYLGGMYAPSPTSATLPPSGTGADFFYDQRGGLLGGKVGIELLYIDLYLQFDQYVNSEGFAGSDLKAMLGWDMNFGCHHKPCWGGVFGIYGGGIFGFPYTPHVPIDKGQIATYGIGAEGQIGAEYHFNDYFVFQLLGTVGYHYLFDGSQGFTISNSGNVTYSSTSGFHFLATAGFRFHIYAL